MVTNAAFGDAAVSCKRNASRFLAGLQLEATRTLRHRAGACLRDRIPGTHGSSPTYFGLV